MFTRDTKYLFLIIVIFIAACIETDIYLPAFTDMMEFFSISEEAIQSLLTWNFVGICISGPFYGPISDAIGRKKPLLFALGLFLLGSLFTLMAESFNLMLIGRILQGLGSGGCFTLGTAIIFDAFQQEKAAKALSRINGICPFIMAAAPMLGGYLNTYYGFRSNFMAIAVLVLISFLICAFFFEETLEEKKRKPIDVKKVISDFKKVSLSVPFWLTSLIVSLPFSGYITFLSGISVLFVLELGISKEVLPYYQGALLSAWLLASLTFNRGLQLFGDENVKKIGTGLIFLAGIGVALAGWLIPKDTYFITFSMSLFAFGVNWTQGLYFPEGMELFPDVKGITASLLTSARLLICAAIVGVVSNFYDGSIYPIVIANVIIIAVVTALIIMYEKSKPSPVPANV